MSAMERMNGVTNKLEVEDHLRMAITEFPERIALERLRFALSLVKFMRTELQALELEGAGDPLAEAKLRALRA